MTASEYNISQIQKPAESPKNINYRLLMLIVLAFAGLKIVSLLLLSLTAAQASDLTIANILNAVNNERSLRNLVTLNSNLMLSSAAQSKADDMQARHYFAHIDPDGNYIWTKIVAAGYTPYLQLGENLAIEFDSTDSLMAAWMNSPTHRANILNDGFKDQGMGLSFGNPSNGQYSSAIANTFGALILKKPAPLAPAASVNPAAAPAVQPAANPASSPSAKPVVKPAPKPFPAAVPPAELNKPPLSPRGFALTNAGPGTETENLSATPALISSAANPAPAALNGVAGLTVKNAGLNRYTTLAFGLILLLFLLADLRAMAENRIEHIDKKINNIALLAIALIVIGVLYWL